MNRIIYLIPLLALVSGCSSASRIWASMWNPAIPEVRRTAVVDADTPSDMPQYNYTHYSNKTTIGLQNPNSREIVRCRDTMFSSAEICAEKYEAKGFVRFRDIPYKTANYDFLKVDSYPSRRWRDSELTPRW